MLICHLTSVHPYRDTRIFVKECMSLVNHGFKVHLVAPDATNNHHDNIQLHGLPKTKGNRLHRMTITVREVYKKAIEIDADVYHFHDPELIPVGLLLIKRNKKVIYDVHEDVPRQILSKRWIPKILRSTIAKFVEMVENYAVKKFSGIITATPHISDRFQSLNQNVIDIKNYPILNEFRNDSRRQEVKDMAVAYVGAITRIRGIYEMVDAIGRTNYKLFLGGRFDNQEDRMNLMQTNAWGNVIELGHLRRPEISEVLSKSMAGLVVLHPTVNYVDALPVKMFEYMAAGLPVISSNFPLWKEIIEGNQCGICVDPLNTVEIKDAIEWIMNHPDEARVMGENGRRAVENKYNWDHESKKLIDFYKSIV